MIFDDPVRLRRIKSGRFCFRMGRRHISKWWILRVVDARFPMSTGIYYSDNSSRFQIAQ